MARFILDRAEVQAASREAAREELVIGAAMVENRAKLLAPADTGRLRSSVRKTLFPLKFRVGTNVEYAPYVINGTRPHVIRPRNARALRFRVGGRTVFATRVNHPGTRPRPFLDRALIDVARLRGWRLNVRRID